MVILAGDIGGTNSRLGLFEPDGVSLRKVITTTFPSREYASLEEIVEQTRPATDRTPAITD